MSKENQFRIIYPPIDPKEPESRAVGETGEEVPDVGDYKEDDDGTEDEFEQLDIKELLEQENQELGGTIPLSVTVSNHFELLKSGNLTADDIRRLTTEGTYEDIQALMDRVERWSTPVSYTHLRAHET